MKTVSVDVLEDMLSNESKRGIRTRVLAQQLTEYTEHGEECAKRTGEANKPDGTYVCDCGLTELLEQVDAL